MSTSLKVDNLVALLIVKCFMQMSHMGSWVGWQCGDGSECCSQHIAAFVHAAVFCERIKGVRQKAKSGDELVCLDVFQSLSKVVHLKIQRFLRLRLFWVQE